MSVPERNAVYMSALDEVRVKRGSTLISVAPFSMASVTYLKETGWFSAALLPMIRMQSLFLISIQ
jgi:hypothetical protein